MDTVYICAAESDTKGKQEAAEKLARFGHTALFWEPCAAPQAHLIKMRQRVLMIVRADAILMLHGYETDQAALTELALAAGMGMQTIKPCQLDKQPDPACWACSGTGNFPLDNGQADCFCIDPLCLR